MICLPKTKKTKKQKGENDVTGYIPWSKTPTRNTYMHISCLTWLDSPIVLNVKVSLPADDLADGMWSLTLLEDILQVSGVPRTHRFSVKGARCRATPYLSKTIPCTAPAQR